MPLAMPGAGEPTTEDRARKLVRVHAVGIVSRCEGVTAVGVGRAAGAGPRRSSAIVVHVRRQRDLPRRPLSLDGVRTRFVVSGTFEAQ